MMKNLFAIKLACGVIAVCLMSACGGGHSKSVAVRDVYTYGDLNYYDDEDDWFYSDSDDIEEFLSVADGTYKFSVKDDKLVVEIPVKTIKTLPNLTVDEVEAYLSIIDSEEEYIQNAEGEDVNLKLENPEIINTIMTSNVGDKNILKFYYTLFDETSILEQIEDFELFLEIDLLKGGKVDAGSNNVGSNDANAGSDDWDSILDDYERYADDYIACMKKVQNGDMGAMADLASLAETAQSLDDKLENASDDLSPAQAARYTRITTKFASAMAQM